MLVAMVIVRRPCLLFADDLTSALDAVTQLEILQLSSRLNRNLETSALYISHAVVASRGVGAESRPRAGALPGAGVLRLYEIVPEAGAVPLP